MEITSGRRRGRSVAAIAVLGFVLVCGLDLTRLASRSSATSIPRPPDARTTGLDLGRPAGLPSPSGLTVPRFEGQLFAFLNARRYVELGWLGDKSVRDTGPYHDGKYYGTHPAVRVYYSPGRGALAHERPGRANPRRRDDRQGAVPRPRGPARGQDRGPVVGRA